MFSKTQAYGTTGDDNDFAELTTRRLTHMGDIWSYL